MRKQTKVFMKLLDIELLPAEKVEHRIKNNPEISFDEMFESNDFTLDECASLIQ